MEIDNFNHNLQDMDLNGDHNLQPDFDSSQNLQDQNNLLDSQTMDISHHPTDPSEMDFNQSSPLSNPLEQDNFNNSQVDYSQTISEQQHLNLSQSSAMHDAFNN